MSQITAIKRFNNLDDMAADEELAAIEGEQNLVFNPMELTYGQNRAINTEIQTSQRENNGGN